MAKTGSTIYLRNTQAWSDYVDRWLTQHGHDFPDLRTLELRQRGRQIKVKVIGAQRWLGDRPRARSPRSASNVLAISSCLTTK